MLKRGRRWVWRVVTEQQTQTHEQQEQEQQQEQH